MAEMTPFKCGDAARIIDGEYKGRMGAIVGIGDPEMPSVFTRSLETDNDEEVPVEILKRLPGSFITARNGNRLLSALLRCIFISVLLARAVPGAAQDPISIGSTSIRNPGSAKSNEEISKHSVPQYLPCRGQTKTFGKLSDSFSAGHLPSRSEITGSWVLIGFWLYKDSHPDLNCAGITRGKILDWVMLAQGYSLMIDMAGTNQTSTFEIGPRQDLTVALDLGGTPALYFAAASQSAKLSFVLATHTIVAWNSGRCRFTANRQSRIRRHLFSQCSAIRTKRTTAALNWLHKWRRERARPGNPPSGWVAGRKRRVNSGL